MWGHRPVLEGGREGGREGGGGGGGPAIPILNRKFSDCRIFSPPIGLPARHGFRGSSCRAVGSSLRSPRNYWEIKKFKLF